MIIASNFKKGVTATGTKEQFILFADPEGFSKKVIFALCLEKWVVGGS